MDCKRIRKLVPGMSLFKETPEGKAEVLEHIKHCSSCFAVVQIIYAWGKLMKAVSKESFGGMHMSQFDIAFYLAFAEYKDEASRRHLEDCQSCKEAKKNLEAEVEKYKQEFASDPAVLLREDLDDREIPAAI